MYLNYYVYVIYSSSKQQKYEVSERVYLAQVSKRGKDVVIF